MIAMVDVLSMAAFPSTISCSCPVDEVGVLAAAIAALWSASSTCASSRVVLTGSLLEGCSCGLGCCLGFESSWVLWDILS